MQSAQLESLNLIEIIVNKEFYINGVDLWERVDWRGVLL